MKTKAILIYLILIGFAFAIFITLASLIFAASPCYGVTQTLYDPDGYIYDVRADIHGIRIVNGTSDTYDGAYFLRINGGNYSATNLTVSGRNIVGTVKTVNGLQVIRKL